MRKVIFFLSVFALISCREGPKENKHGGSNKIPNCTITSPVDSSVHFLGDTISIIADITDPDGEIEYAVFYINNQLVFTFDTLPYELEWISDKDSLGTHCVVVSGYDYEGKYYSDSIIYVVKSQLPIVNFKVSSDTIIIDDSVRFTDQSEEKPVSWSWNFGDGNTSTEQNPVHLYTKPGEYTVQLTVSNQYGIQARSKKVFVSKFSTVSDIEGNIYKTVKIKDQWWMAENLRVGKYNSGTSFTYSGELVGWQGNGWYMGYYTYYNENKSGAILRNHGALYNAYVALGEKNSNGYSKGNVCPSGWHVSTDADWLELERTIGIRQEVINEFESARGDESYKLKSETEWEDNPEYNSTGFNALPSGEFNVNEYFEFYGQGSNVYFWTSTSYTESNTTQDNVYRKINKADGSIYRGKGANYYGMSIRCVKD